MLVVADGCCIVGEHKDILLHIGFGGFSLVGFLKLANGVNGLATHHIQSNRIQQVSLFKHLGR